MPEVDTKLLREYLHWIEGLLTAMQTSLLGEDPENVWKHGGYKQYARKYNQIVTEIMKKMPLPDIVDYFNLEQIPGIGDTIAIQQKELFESVYANASILRGIVKSKLGEVENEIDALKDFFSSRLRRAIFNAPKNERDIQNTVEQLLIGHGYQKGNDYDREVGRVKVSSKEVVPDFIMIKLGLAIELKIVSRKARAKEVIDEINADIQSYSKDYRCILFIVYDMGFIRDETEFRRDLETKNKVSVLVVKH